MSRSASMRDKVRPARGFQQLTREKVRPTRPLQRHFREKVRPASAKTPILGCFKRAGRTFSRSRPPSGHAGRTFSRTWRNNMATLKPTTPLLTPNKGLLKPASPLPPKNAPKTPISRPQRRRRFRRFQSHSSTSEQRRWQFQTTGPPGLQNPDAIPVASGGAWLGYSQRPGPTGVEGAGGVGGPGCDARGRWQGLAGLRDDAPSEAR